jgi:carbamoyl-phosphate synthase large subunit
MGVETVMVNCNPETVSTDYDTSDRLYFEPLTLEDVLAICVERGEAPRGDRAVRRADAAEARRAARAARRALSARPPDAIDRAEDRERFAALLDEARPEAAAAHARSLDEARGVGSRASIGYPVLVRPSYVLGGRAMMICHDEAELDAYVRSRSAAREAGHPVLIDEFLETRSRSTSTASATASAW